MEKLRIVVGGFIGLYPTGGATWDYIQYPLGLKLLGHDVYYLEDTCLYPVYQKEGVSWDDASGCVKYLKQVMTKAEMGERWGYRDIASGNSFGITEKKIREILKTADIFINISCSTFLKDEYLKIPKRILIDSDPMFTQMRYYNEINGFEKKSSTKDMLENHNYLFSFGENINEPDCRIPKFHFNWSKTRQPICLDEWANSGEASNSSFTSIMNWTEKKKLIYQNEEWGQKDVEFRKFEDIPMKCPDMKFEVVINRSLNAEKNFHQQQLINKGWRILDPHNTVDSPAKYRNYIQTSSGEFSIAKETYVKANTGWFSCRSACYLAAGKPVITQDTGWSRNIPAGKGLFAFTDMNSAIFALEQVKNSIKQQSKMAREIAYSYFDSNLILTNLIEQLN